MMPRWVLPVVLALALGMSVSAHAATIQITMENLVIAPAEATAKVGDTLELINKDILAHTATARNGDFDVAMPPKKTVIYVLKKAGSVEYYCRFHPNMKAVLNVAPRNPAGERFSGAITCSEFDDLRFAAFVSTPHEIARLGTDHARLRDRWAACTHAQTEHARENHKCVPFHDWPLLPWIS